MPTAIHSFSQEEIMSYLDGELSPERALAAAQHVEQCRECQQLAADFRSVSERFVQWEIEPSASEAPQLARETEKKWAVFWKQPWMLIAGVSSIALLVLVGIIPLLRQEPTRQTLTPQQAESRPNVSTFLADRPAAGLVGGVVGGQGEPSPPPPGFNALAARSGPLIVRTAQLAVTSKKFDRSQADVDHITAQYRGYIAQLEVSTPSDAVRSLDATLRVPATQLDAVLQKLRGLGHVDSESQRGEDVTRRSVDVQARLANLQATEMRLLQILRERTGRLADVLQVEEAVDRTRGEIEASQAEQKSLSTQIAFASIHLRVSEEYKAALGSNGDSVVTKLQNAAVNGYRNMVVISVGILVGVLSAGPALVIGLAIAFFPMRWLWRRYR